MIISRIKKYRHALQAIINEKNELRKLDFDNSSQMVKKAFLHVKKGKYDVKNQNILNQLSLYQNELSSNEEKISYEIFNIDKKRIVSEIAGIAGSLPKWCEFFYFLAKFSNAQNILEIGTNLGISGQYFLSAISDRPSKFISLEGIPRLCEIASERFEKINDKAEFEVIQGLYDTTLPKIATGGQKFNIVFFDGNHQYEPTVHYFDLLKNNYSENAILIFDDINWNEGMKKAWKHIKNDSSIYFTIDFFRSGIALYSKKPQYSKNHAQLFMTL